MVHTCLVWAKSTLSGTATATGEQTIPYCQWSDSLGVLLTKVLCEIKIGDVQETQSLCMVDPGDDCDRYECDSQGQTMPM